MPIASREVYAELVDQVKVGLAGRVVTAGPRPRSAGTRIG